MVQGGGLINGAFLKAGLLDEISHVTIPVADGGAGIASFFDIPHPMPKKATALKLIKRTNLPGGVTWVRYRVR
jgi:5-amino-6-(5-phosphoribosylamino)uracil reductase